jgi:GNAT superfamily N-acetyltransferase
MQDDAQGDEVHAERAAPDDWATWRELRLRALATDPDAFGSTLDSERDQEEAAWRGWLEQPCVLGFLGGRAVATGALHPTGAGAVDVVAMWVAPEARGRGVGARVLADLVALAGPGTTIALWVAEGSAARRVYERAGFTATDERAPIRPGATVMKRRMVRG